MIMVVGVNNNSKTINNVKSMVMDQVTNEHYIAKGNIK